MLFCVVLDLVLFFGRAVLAAHSASDSADFGDNLIQHMKNDANLDLSVDEEYEDLRAELLAYHTAFASLTSTVNRRSMATTACWELGGICVNYKLCSGFRYLTEVPGCKDKLNVCCFTWNRYKVSDFRDKGIGSLAMPWPLQYEFGGEGVKVKEPEIKKKKKKRIENLERIENLDENPEEHNSAPQTLAFVIKTN